MYGVCMCVCLLGRELKKKSMLFFGGNFPLIPNLNDEDHDGLK